MKEVKKFNIIISKKLKDVLSEFDSESQIARFLLGREQGELVDNPVNYISLSDQDITKISYLSDDRIEKILTFCKENGYTPSMTDNLLWTSGIRFCARPGSFITKIFKNVSPKEIEKFSTLYRTNVNKPRFKFSIVNGENIREYYHYESYSQKGCGTLGNSCMKHEGCQKFLNMYTDNKEVVSMLVMLDDDGTLLGRALLWKYESYKIMDRIYTINDETYLFYFKKWASDNGFLYKSEQNWYNTLYFESLNNKKQEVKLDLKLPNISEYRYYPYVDTFKWLNMETGTVSNYIPVATDKRNIKVLASSDGGRLDHDYIILDGIDNVHRYKNECAFIDYLNLWTYQGNADYSEINGKWILKKDSKYDDELGDYIFIGEYDSLNNKSIIDERIADLRHRREVEAKRRSIRLRQRDSGMISRISEAIANGDTEILSNLSNMSISDIVEGYRHIAQLTGEPVVTSEQRASDIEFVLGGAEEAIESTEGENPTEYNEIRISLD